MQFPQSPKRQKIDIASVLMIALGYNPLTVDRVYWDDEYAERTCLISKAFYEAYVQLNIHSRVVVRDYYSDCVWSINCIHSRTGFVDIVHKPEPSCGADKKHLYTLFEYHKQSKVLTGIECRKGLRIEFKCGKAIMWISKSGVQIPAEYITETILLPGIQGDRIIPYMQQIKTLCNAAKTNMLERIWRGGYTYIDNNGTIGKRRWDAITHGDTQIMRGWWGDDSTIFRMTPDPGIKRIYAVYDKNLQFILTGCIDQLGYNYVYGEDRRLFCHRQHTYCIGIEYHIGNDMPETPEIQEARRTTFWDFSTPIPQRYVVGDVRPCCRQYVQE